MEIIQIQNKYNQLILNKIINNNSNQMISLKTHNDMIEKMIQQNQKLENQVKELSIKLKKLQAFKQVQSLKDKDIGKKNKEETLKINKIQKQYKDKIEQINKVLLAKELQISELKERLEIKLNIDEKQKQHIIQTFRKFQGRKPNSSNDYKLMSIINHYETQIDKKDKTIDKLQKDVQSYKEISRNLKKQLVDKENDSSKINQIEMQSQNIKNEMQKDMETLQIKKLTKQLQKNQKKIQMLTNQNKQIQSRYQQLVKDYYKLMNEYGDLGKLNKPQKQKNNISMIKKNSYIQEKEDLEAPPQPISLQYSLASSHRSNPFLQKSSTFILQDEQQQFIQKRLNEQYHSIIEKLKQIYNIQNYEEIVPTAIKLDVAIKNLPKMENCLSLIKSSFEKILNSKVNFSKIQTVLKNLEEQIQQGLDNTTLIKELEIKLGIKKSGIIQAIQKIKKENIQYYDSLKTISYVKNLAISKQIKQFIEFFDLDPEKQLPTQVVQLYQQLKALQKFKTICNKLLETKLNTSECLQYVLKTLQRMKGDKYNDSDLIQKLEQQLNVQSYQILKKIKQLKKKRES